MRVLYFGIYNPRFSRNKIYISGLRVNGVTVLECQDSSPGIKKYWKLWKKHRTLKNSYDVMIVGYPGHLVVPFAKLISSKPVIADLLGSLFDAEVHSRRPGFIRRMKSALIDRLAIWCADRILLESQAQKQYFNSRFGHSKKYAVLYTGADDSIFYCSAEQAKENLIVLFRGRLTPESGILHILKAASLLREQKNVRFRVIGFGQLLNDVQQFITKNDLSNVELLNYYLTEEELREVMCEASLALGQFEQNPRLSRTIPHKAFESMAMGMPYLSGDTPAIREILEEGKTGYLVPLANPKALAAKISSLLKDMTDLDRVGKNCKELFDEQFTPTVLSAELLHIISA